MNIDQLIEDITNQLKNSYPDTALGHINHETDMVKASLEAGKAVAENFISEIIWKKEVPDDIQKDLALHLNCVVSKELYRALFSHLNIGKYARDGLTETLCAYHAILHHLNKVLFVLETADIGDNQIVKEQVEFLRELCTAAQDWDRVKVLEAFKVDVSGVAEGFFVVSRHNRERKE